MEGRKTKEIGERKGEDKERNKMRRGEGRKTEAMRKKGRRV